MGLGGILVKKKCAYVLIVSQPTGIEIEKNNMPSGVCIKSEEHKRRIGKTLEGRHLSEGTKKKISKALEGNHRMLGKHHSEKTKQKMRKARIKFMALGKIKTYNTSIELAIEAELIRRSIPYLKQVSIEGITLVDFLLPNKIIVQVDGTYWHSREKNKGKDIAQDTELFFKGYKVFRFIDKEINKSAKKCINKVIGFQKVKDA